VAISMIDKAKGHFSQKAIEKAALMLRKGDDRQLASLFRAIASIAPARYHRETFKQLSDMVLQNDPFVGVVRRIALELNPHCLSKFIQNLVVNFMVLGRGIRDKKEKEYNVHLPNFMVISPTMKCNLHCKGCYAAEYDTSNELTFGELDKLLTDAKELGMYFFTFSGGEAFFRNDLLDLWEKHDDCYFQVYTNGTLLDDTMVQRLVDLGNVMPMISVEGSRELTDLRRGQGIYDKVIAAYRRLNEAGVMFGFSATYTRNTADYMSSDEFIKTMIDRGCKIGWFFQYVPIGENPDLTYMSTPKQRSMLHKKVEEWRHSGEFPIFIGDFWNDGPYVDGCMAAGERYWHVISDGSVEPCVFAPFAVDNIREKSLVEIAGSPFFTYIRNQLPYDGDDNLLRPCMILDHPEVLRDAVKKFGARPCHEGLEKILSGSIPRALDEYAREMKEIYDPLWKHGEKEKYLKSLEKEDKKEWLERMNLPAGSRR